LLKLAEFAMAQQDIRYYLNGMLLVVDKGSLQAVATDGHRLSYASITVDGDYARQEVILPRKTVLELGKLLEDSDAEVKIDLLANQVRFRFGNIELVSKVVDGKFPDYNRVIPVGHAKQIELTRSELAAGTQRAAILSNEKFCGGVRLVLGNGQLKIICTNSEQEEAEEELEVGYQGEPLTSASTSLICSTFCTISAPTRSCWHSAMPIPAHWSRCRRETTTNMS
jgi:DNA polymerase-3 subunit beta